MSEPVRSPDLLQHLERLYALAQVLTPDAEGATRLVEATYERAFAARPEDRRPSMDEKAWLFRLMLDVQRGHAVQPEAAPDGLAAYRRSLAGAFLTRTLPTAFATLPPQERLVLVLCEVEGLSCADAGAVLDLDPAAVCHRLETARTVLMNLLRTSATPAERPLIETSLPEGALEEALRRLVQEGFAPLPPTLLPTLTASTPTPATYPDDVHHPDVRDSDVRHPDVRKRRVGRRVPVRASQPLGRLRRSIGALAIIGAAGLLGYLLTVPQTPQAPEVNLITLSARQAGDATDLALRTNSPEQAERFVRDRLGWRLTVPSISGATLSGVGIEEVAPEVDVPVFVFSDQTTGRPVTLYAYTYALLQRFGDRIELERDILRQIENDAHVDIHDLGEEKVLVWRHRDDIYVAVTRSDAEALRQRIFFPS